MRRHESLSFIADEREQLGLLRVVERHVAMPHEEDGVDVGQAGTTARRLPCRLERLLRDDVRIGADEGVVGAGLVAEPFDHGKRMRYRVVLRLSVTGVGPGQDHLARARAAAALPAPLRLPLANRPLPPAVGWNLWRLLGGAQPTTRHQCHRAESEPGASHALSHSLTQKRDHQREHDSTGSAGSVRVTVAVP